MRHRRPSLKREAALWCEGRSIVAGIDEVGRGPLAGPVVAAAVVFPMGAKLIRGLDDSKVLTALQRQKFAVKIRERAAAFAVGAASVHEIDRLNIRRASILAMARALRRLGIVPAHVLIDGLPCPELGCEHEAIVEAMAAHDPVEASHRATLHAREAGKNVARSMPAGPAGIGAARGVVSLSDEPPPRPAPRRRKALP